MNLADRRAKWLAHERALLANADALRADMPPLPDVGAVLALAALCREIAGEEHPTRASVRWQQARMYGLIACTLLVMTVTIPLRCLLAMGRR